MVQTIQQKWNYSQQQPHVVYKVKEQKPLINFVSMDVVALVNLISSNLFIIFVIDLEET